MLRGGPNGHTWLGIWRDLDPATRREVAAASLEAPHLAKALVIAVARHDRVRRQSVERWDLEKQALHVARMRRLPNAKLAAALLTHFHLTRRQRLVVSFLDFLKVPHDAGVIRDIDTVEPPARSRMIAAIRRMSTLFPPAHVSLFFDVVSCQTSFAVFREFDSARLEALPSEHAVIRRATPSLDTFGGQLDADFSSEPTAPEEPAPAAAADDTPPTFTTLDQVLIRSVIASVAEVHGALSPEKVEDLVEEVVQLNLERHQSYFHRGFLAVLLGRPLELDFPEASDVRRGWYACGAILGLARRGMLDAIVGLLTERQDLARELARPGTGYAERVVSTVFSAFCAKGRYAEVARFLSPAVVGYAGVQLAEEILETASGLIRQRREADARRLLDVLLAALPALREDPDLPQDFEVLLSRRRAHCARLRGDFEGAKKLLLPQLTAAEADVRSDILADLGLIDCGLRSLADVRLPPDESMLAEFGAQFEKGWPRFLESSRVAAGGRSHGDFCIGLALFARGQTDEAIPYLERAVAGMGADPDRYGQFGPLDTARLALAVALAEQTDLARVPYARDLMSQVLDSKHKVPDYLPRRVLVAVELTDPEIAVEIAREIYASRNSRSLGVLAETRLIRYLPEALDELLELAGRDGYSKERRFEAARVVLAESHAMRDAPSAERPPNLTERATEALDVLVELADEEPFRGRLLELLDTPNGAWRAAMDPTDRRVVRAALLEDAGAFANAASELVGAFHETLDADDEWALGKAEALLEDIRALGGDEAVEGLEARLAQYRVVFERRSQSGLVIPPTVDPEDFYGLVLVIGGNETQAAQDAAIAATIKEQWPNVSVVFERTGWSSNWGEQLRVMESELTRARAVVLMRYVRTMLGRAIRKRCSELELPWIACTGSGRASMVRAIEQAILLAWRQGGMARHA
ncbi:MAG: hypothetical protein KF729_02400 [Sandaracinaceae bacterium]|nr:hypothetical protein [Sandaracinaceae bacterium]